MGSVSVAEVRGECVFGVGVGGQLQFHGPHAKQQRYRLVECKKLHTKSGSSLVLLKSM